MFCNEGLKLRGVMFAGKRVRVVTVGKKADFDVHSFFNAADRSLDTCCVTVVKYGHVVGETVNHADLSRCKSSS